MPLAEPTPYGAKRRIYRNAAAETSTATARVKLELPDGVEVLRIVGVNVVGSGGTVTRVDPAIYDSASGGTRLWLGRWGSVTPGLLGDWGGGEVEVALFLRRAAYGSPHTPIRATGASSTRSPLRSCRCGREARRLAA